MKRLLLAPFCFLVSCNDPEVVYDEAGKMDGGAMDATMPMPDASEAGPMDADPDNAAPPRLLMTQVAGMQGELSAFNLMSGKVDGTLTYAGFATTHGSSAGPFLIETGVDIVARLDSKEPWKIASSWSVALNDAYDGGESYANPCQVIPVSPTKAYVLRYNRNRIAIIDPTQIADGGAPSGSIDLQGLLQADDKDGHIDMSGGIYDPVRKRVYVALANIDLGRVDPMGFFQICASTVSTLIAIDTNTDQLVSIGSGPGGGVTLNGRSPQFGVFGGVTFDAAGDRVLVMSTGCNDKYADGGASPLKGRVIEAVSLTSNTTTTLLDANNQDFPGQLVFVSQNKAIVQFGYGAFSTTFTWDPSKPMLGAPLSTTPEIFAYEPKNDAIVGPRTEKNDAGTKVNVIRVPNVVDGGSSVLGSDPFTKKGDYFGNAALWAP